MICAETYKSMILRFITSTVSVFGGRKTVVSDTILNEKRGKDT